MNILFQHRVCYNLVGRWCVINLSLLIKWRLPRKETHYVEYLVSAWQFGKFFKPTLQFFIPVIQLIDNLFGLVCKLKRAAV